MAVTIQENCTAHIIPQGTPITLKKSQQGIIMQEQGRSFTLSIDGMLVRIDKKYAQAIGVTDTSPPTNKNIVAEKITTEFILEQLKECFDPEIPVNVVDLGLIYACEIKKSEENTEFIDIHIIMTLTAFGCGMGEFIAMDIQKILEEFFVVNKASVEISFDPPWSQSRMSEVAKLKLGLI